MFCFNGALYLNLQQPLFLITGIDFFSDISGCHLELKQICQNFNWKQKKSISYNKDLPRTLFHQSANLSSSLTLVHDIDIV